MKISTNQFKNGTKLLIDNAPCSIIEHEFHKPGKGQAVIRKLDHPPHHDNERDIKQ